MIESVASMLHKLWLFFNVFWTGSEYAEWLLSLENILAFKGLGSLVKDEDVDAE